ncbi:bifunctional diguanylate cyclase/phosphodiesterase [Methylophaga lonarensis]
MSLSKQLLVLISLIFFIVFSVNFLLSVNNIRSYLEGESQIHVQDTATSLGLSMSPHMADENDPILRTMMSAIFDMGYYREMRLLNVDGDELVRLTNTERLQGVPDWLIQWLPMETATAETELSSGWNIAGTLYVTSNPGYGYLKLYQQIKSTLTYSLVIFALTVLLLYLVLQLTLRSLRAIERQANEISAGHFVEVEPLPMTTEVRNLTISMNSMSRKLADTISRMNSKLAKLNDSIMRDPLTGLLNQESFNRASKSAIASREAGHAIFIKFDDLAAIAREHGNSAVDKLLIEFSALLRHHAGGQYAYRLYGSEFALLLKTAKPAEMIDQLKDLQKAINHLGEHYNVRDLLHIGVVPFDLTSEYDRLMPALIEAYEQARLIGPNAFHIRTDSLSSMSEQAWKVAIDDAIEHNTPEITFTSKAYNHDGAIAIEVMQEAFTVVKNADGETMSIGTFFSMAQVFGRVEALDKCIVNKIIQLMETSQDPTPVTVNLSMQSIASEEFRIWLKSRLQQSKVAPEQLAFSVTAYAAAKQLDVVRRFNGFVRELGATTLLKRYAADVIPVDRLRDLQLDYLRLARDVTTNITGNASKPDFLEIIQQVSGLLNIKVLAEGVISDEDFEIVQKAGIYGISR